MRLLFFLFIGCFSVWLSPQARADYADVIEFFDDLHGTADAADFPVSGRDFSDIESAFGPRVQTSGGNYDWHRGIDIDGTLNTDPVVAALDGYFYDYRTLDAGGYIVILEHRFADFGVFGLTYEGESVTRFYTWYLHLYDDGLEGNDTSTDDIVSAFTEDDPTFTTKLVVPSEWLQGFESPRYRVDVTAVDIWGNSVVESAQLVPEPGTGLLCLWAVGCQSSTPAVIPPVFIKPWGDFPLARLGRVVQKSGSSLPVMSKDLHGRMRGIP